MKKVLLFIAVVIGLACIPVTIYCAEEEVPVEAETTEIATEDEFKEKASEWLSKYFEKSKVSDIINWCIDTGVLAALFGVYLKYSKFKHLSVEELIEKGKEEISKNIKENFDSMSAEKLQALIDKIGELESANETMMKVLVLSQDTTLKGKAALIDFLGSKTQNEDVKTAAKEVGAEIEKQELKKEETKQALEEIF